MTHMGIKLTLFQLTLGDWFSEQPEGRKSSPNVSQVEVIVSQQPPEGLQLTKNFSQVYVTDFKNRRKAEVNSKLQTSLGDRFPEPPKGRKSTHNFSQV